MHVPTFGEKASVPVVHVSAQKPAIAKVVVALDELNAVSLCQAQLVCAACYEVVHDQQDGAGLGICHAAQSRRHVGAVCGVVSGVRAQLILGGLHAMLSGVLQRLIPVCTLGECLTVYHAGAAVWRWARRDKCRLVMWGCGCWIEGWWCWRSGTGVGAEGAVDD